MSSRKPASVTRRLLKIASLGLAGFLVGLLSGCSPANTVAHLSAWESGSNTAASRLQNPDDRRIPEFSRAPSPHHSSAAAPQPRTTPVNLGEIDAVGHHHDSHHGQ
jgi:hypothetical protein